MKFIPLFLLVFLYSCNNDPKTNNEQLKPSQGNNENLNNVSESDNDKAKTPPLDSADFVVNGFSTDINEKTLTNRLGKPDSISITGHPFDTGSKISTWYYKDIVFLFVDDSTCQGFYINSNKYSTKRGLTIGDPVSKMIKLYGKNDNPFQGDYDYVDNQNEIHLIRITTEKGKVKEIYLGYIMD